MTALAPWRPSAAAPWDRRRAMHLLRRAGFAPSAAEVERALADGVASTVDRLVDETRDSARHDELDGLGAAFAARGEIDALRAWWLLRLRHTERPLAARLGVMWHNHFATSHVKVRDARLMYAQLRTIERLALGPFATLLLAMSRDPAMIVWLDGAENVNGRPNENYARELLELFTLGVGHYAEADIREAARAFTGWRQRDGRFDFARHLHDGGEKSVLGVAGRLDGADVVRIVTDHPSCAAFLARRLLGEFVGPNAPATLVDAVAGRLRETDLDVGETLRTLLRSESFFDEAWYRARIKSPVEYAIGLARSFDLQVPGPTLADATSNMGQALFEPPSVEGWPGHREWLNSATMLVRLNAASGVATEQLDAPTFADRHGLTDARAAIAFARDLTLDGVIAPALDERLRAIDGAAPDALRRAAALLLASPEYQMA